MFQTFEVEDEDIDTIPISTSQKTPITEIPNSERGQGDYFVKPAVPPQKPVLEEEQLKPKEAIIKSEIYKSISKAREEKNSVDYKPIKPPEKDSKLDISQVDETGDLKPISKNEDKLVKIELIVKKLRLEAGKLCQIEAREAFAAYLTRVQQRFLTESADQNVKNHRPGIFLIFLLFVSHILFTLI